MKRERIISTDEVDLPDDPETTRMATAVVIFCIFAGPTIVTLIMLITIHSEAIDKFMTDTIIFLYNSPFITFTLMLYTCVLVVYLIYKRAKKP